MVSGLFLLGLEALEPLLEVEEVVFTPVTFFSFFPDPMRFFLLLVVSALDDPGLEDCL